MNLFISAMSDVGCVRQNNEDMVLSRDQFIRDRSYEDTLIIEKENTLIAVSDGMGGHNAGEMASEFVLRKMSEVVASIGEADKEDFLKEELGKHIREIHANMNDIGNKNPAMKGWGCTFTGIVIYREKLFLVHLGDSRLYRLRGRFLAQLSSDHTLRNLLNDPSIPVNKIANCFGGAYRISFSILKICLTGFQPGMYCCFVRMALVVK